MIPNDKAPLQIQLGALPHEHAICANGKPFNIVLALEATLGLADHPAGMVTLECYLPEPLHLEGELGVSWIGPVAMDHGRWDAQYRVQLDLTIPGGDNCTTQCKLNDEVFPFLSAKVRADALDHPKVEIMHYHRPFPTDGSKREVWVLRGELVRV